MAEVEKKLAELERRLQKLEQHVFGGNKATTKPQVVAPKALTIEDLNIPNEVLSPLRERIRKVGYLDLTLILLYYSPHSLAYSEIMSLSKELKKPVSYNWLNTEFHRKKHSGLVRSEAIPGSKQRAYSLNEPGRRRVEKVLAGLKAVKE